MGRKTDLGLRWKQRKIEFVVIERGKSENEKMMTGYFDSSRGTYQCV